MLEHPGIVPVHDLLLDPAGRPMLVMKLVEGRNWLELLAGAPGPHKRPLSGEEHLDILLKVCDAVAFAHSRGILHRDIKPENVMVGSHGEVLLMDWGCAVSIADPPPHPDIPALAAQRTVNGTPAYIAPEMARAETARCGPWSDVWLLGAVLYRMLAGRPPHRGGDIAATIAAAGACSEAPDPAAAGRPVPGELARICRDALHPDPERRTRSATDFAAAIRRYLEHREVLRLVGEAGRQHQLARAGGAEADDAYRRAISTVEQAVQLWPEHLPARRLLVEIGMDSARHALASGALRVARRQAQAVAAEAERLGDGPAVDAAQRLAALADARERSLAGREASLRIMRRLAVGGAAVAMLALLVGLLAVWRGSARTADALAEARANLALAEQERTARVEGERLAAPALLAQARERIAAGKAAEALPLLVAAQAFAPEDPGAFLLAGQIHAALGRRTEAAIALGRAVELRPDALVEELRQISAARPPDADLRTAEVLVRMGAGSLAGAIQLQSATRARLAKEALRRTMPRLADSAVQILPDGTLSLVLADHGELDSLATLAGMPVTRLELRSLPRVRDLAPLAGLPLQQLTISGLPPLDLTPLGGAPLQRLSVPGLAIPVGLLARWRLQYLRASGAGLHDLGALAGQPLRELRLSGCDQLEDISALRGMQLEVLELDAPNQGAATLVDLAPLKGLPLRELSLANQRSVADLAPLKGAPLARLVISGTAVADLAPIAGPSLRFLSLAGCPVEDLRPLRSSGLDTLTLSAARIRHGLKELAGMPGLRAVNGLAPRDFATWNAIERALATDNPAYGWDGAAVFEGGKLVELRLRGGIANIVALKGQALRVLEMGGNRCKDLSPLVGMPLQRLDLRGHEADLAVLARLPELRTLHAGRVADLAVLARLPLRQLSFDTRGVKSGIEVLRASRIAELGAEPSRLLPASEFWAAWDRGAFR
jgi:tetratricopeptide (TPR) repeat protein